MNPKRLPLDASNCIATYSTEEPGVKRWTVLSVHYLPDTPQPWVAVSVGASLLQGERRKEQRLPSASLYRALSLFDDTDIGRAVSAMAHEWAEDNGIPKARYNVATPQTGRDALAFLFGEESYEDVSMAAAGRMLGVGESTLRAALKDDRDVRVSLKAIFPFIDRAGFQNRAHRENGRG